MSKCLKFQQPKGHPEGTPKCKRCGLPRADHTRTVSRIAGRGGFPSGAAR